MANGAFVSALISGRASSQKGNLDARKHQARLRAVFVNILEKMNYLQTDSGSAINECSSQLVPYYQLENDQQSESQLKYPIDQLNDVAEFFRLITWS